MSSNVRYERESDDAGKYKNKSLKKVALLSMQNNVKFIE